MRSRIGPAAVDLAIGFGIWASATLLIVAVGPVLVPFAASPWRWLLLVLVGIATYVLSALLHRWGAGTAPTMRSRGYGSQAQCPSSGSPPMASSF